MKKIVMLPGTEMQDRLFSKAAMERLSSLGDLVINKDAKGLDIPQTMNLIKDADVIISTWGCPKMTKDLLDCAPKLALLLHAAGSVKGIVTPEFWERGIRVSNAAEPLGKGVAETALGYTITALKYMWTLSQSLREGEWSKGREYVRELFGISVGVIGAGCAGRHYIRLLRNFDVDVLLYDPVISEEKAAALGARKVELDELLTKVDAVSIHAPSIPATDKMFNKYTLSLMKDNAIIVNTARGTIIDEAALLEELKKGRLFACLDVTDPEPPAKDHPFRNLPNVIMTPHIAGAVNNGQKRIGNFIADELDHFMKGEQLTGEMRLSEMSVLA